MLPVEGTGQPQAWVREGAAASEAGTAAQLLNWEAGGVVMVSICLWGGGRGAERRSRERRGLPRKAPGGRTRVPVADLPQASAASLRPRVLPGEGMRPRAG